jgi:hypothetical protein
VIHELTDGFRHGDVDLDDLVLALLFIMFGSRAVQLAALKLMDYRAVKGDAGLTLYTLQIPRAKQRHGLRAEFKTRTLPR